ncbi:hypothetical protein OIU84_022286 [Salix udensis]|uniref:Uncharacterized protein n=1 Tax=Salix udensis TaxID=889485 RepID=A0AAD6KN73_9ROSI|nr:hypothetical protein OIU84_022286 [Salix udensis]
MPFDRRETSFSDSSSSRGFVHSDEEVLLAISCPKKRAGRRVFRETRHPVFRGVRKRNGSKWLELMMLRHWHLEANLPALTSLILLGGCPVPVSKDAKDITRAANEAAELFRPQEFGGHPAKKRNSNAVVEDCSAEICSDDSQTFQENDVFFEEAVFDMPGLLLDMAEGLLLSPPRYARNDSTDWDHMGKWF